MQMVEAVTPRAAMSVAVPDGCHVASSGCQYAGNAGTRRGPRSLHLPFLFCFLASVFDRLHSLGSTQPVATHCSQRSGSPLFASRSSHATLNVRPPPSQSSPPNRILPVYPWRTACAIGGHDGERVLASCAYTRNYTTWKKNRPNKQPPPSGLSYTPPQTRRGSARGRCASSQNGRHCEVPRLQHAQPRLLKRTRS